MNIQEYLNMNDSFFIERDPTATDSFTKKEIYIIFLALSFNIRIDKTKFSLEKQLLDYINLTLNKKLQKKPVIGEKDSYLYFLLFAAWYWFIIELREYYNGKRKVTGKSLLLELTDRYFIENQNLQNTLRPAPSISIKDVEIIERLVFPE